MDKYLIIGAGPAGLSAGVALSANSIPFEIVDAGVKVGGIWDISRKETPMYKSAHFISSRTLSGFSDYPIPTDYPDYPNHELVQSYIEDYASHHDLNKSIHFNTKVSKAIPTDNKWSVTFDNGTKGTYAGLIIATGITWHKNFPALQGKYSGRIIHSFDYKSSELFKDKKVLIIGAGNSGCDIACDAAREAGQAFISMRRGYYFIPKYLFGMPSDLFKEKYGFPIKRIDRFISELLLNKVVVGNLENYGLQKPDHGLLQSHPIMNNRLLHHLGHGDISAKPDIDSCDGKMVRFKDGSQEEIDLIVTATGYKRTFPFLDDEIIKSKEHKQVDLYLEMFHRTHDNLFFTGGIEVSSAIFGLLSLQGETIAAAIKAKNRGNTSYKNFLDDKRTKQHNLKRNNRYISSLRHERYVDKPSYQKLLKRQIKSFAHD